MAPSHRKNGDTTTICKGIQWGKKKALELHDMAGVRFMVTVNSMVA
jgi:hypothetical protein